MIKIKVSKEVIIYLISLPQITQYLALMLAMGLSESDALDRVSHVIEVGVTSVGQRLVGSSHDIMLVGTHSVV